MKKIKYLMIFIAAFPVFLLIAAIGMFGGSPEQSQPVPPPASEEQAYKYMYVGSELGTPWDIVIMADAITADNNDQDSIEDYNALLTSLQFCSITEKKYIWVEQPSPTADPSASPAPTTAPASGEWVYDSTMIYAGKDKILQYLKLSENDIDYSEAATMASDIKKRAEGKSDDNTKYEAEISVNSDYRYILSHYIKLDEDSIDNIMDIYTSKYLVALYGYDDVAPDVELPNITVGNVTRSDLEHVAVSLMNYPYMFGGKSPTVGAPANPLDCSGFVDWVYMQCFGKCVSGASGGTEMQFYSCSEITESDLQIGDLGFYYDPADMTTGQINHVGIYIGKIGKEDAFIHCGGSSFGYDARPSGRVGISINESGKSNTYNSITGGTFSPAMPGTNFKYFRRPQFQFKD